MSEPRTPEKVTLPNDWRRFLDLLEEIGGSTTADDLFRRWIVTPEQEPLLDARADARAAYASLLEAGKGWEPGYYVRDPMGRWEFGRATRAITEATDVLATRDQIAARAAEVGVAPPGSLEDAYEGATENLDAVRELASAQLTTATSLDAASERVAAERDVFTSIGLIGEDPVASLAAASAAFSAGDTATADRGVASVDSLMAGAADSGRTRTLSVGLAGAGLVAVGVGGAMALRRRRQRPDWMFVEDAPMAVVAEPRPPGGAEPYATLGDPRSAEATADTEDPPAEPGRDKGVDR